MSLVESWIWSCSVMGIPTEANLRGKEHCAIVVSGERARMLDYKRNACRKWICLHVCSTTRIFSFVWICRAGWLPIFFHIAITWIKLDKGGHAGYGTYSSVFYRSDSPSNPSDPHPHPIRKSICLGKQIALRTWNLNLWCIHDQWSFHEYNLQVYENVAQHFTTNSEMQHRNESS